MSLATFGRLWEAAKDLWSVLRPMRFCILVGLVIGYLIFAVAQSQDGLLALVDDALSLFEGKGWAGTLNAVFFAALAFGWGFQTFYWARFVSRIPPDPRPAAKYPPRRLSPGAIRWLDRTLPHWLGGVVLAWVGIAVFKANLSVPDRERVIVAVTTAALLLYVYLVRRGRRDLADVLFRLTNLPAFQVGARYGYDLRGNPLSSTLRRRGLALVLATLAAFVASAFYSVPDTGKGEIGLALGVIWIGFTLWGAGQIAGLPRSTVLMLRINVVVSGLLFLTSIAQVLSLPEGLGWLNWLHFLNSPPIIMAVAGAWVFGGTFFLAYPGEVLGLPLTTLLAAFAVAVGVIGWYDNHAVRVIRKTSPAQVDIDQAYEAWRQAQPDPEHPRMIIVATAGGASRAAYWTMEVLGHIEQEHPDFHRHVFAISSVSGGSLGAVVYRAMLNDLPGATPPADGAACPGGKATEKTILNCGLATIDHDFLGPTFLTGLYADLTQRLMPGALLPDRAGALEKSWEAAWAKTLPGASVKFSDAFSSLWPTTRSKEEWLPALLINGTSEKTGRRIITSNLKIDDSVFFDAVDFFARVQRDTYISTAIHNSARFPYIDAAGTLRLGGHRVVDRLLDGGYFENFGAGTAYDLAFYLRNRPNLQIFILQISSDPDLQSEGKRDDAWPKPASWTLNVASDVTAPPVGFYNTREGVGYRATKVAGAYADRDDNYPPKYSFFTLTDRKEPMNWVLSDDAQQAIRGEWDDSKNQQAFQNLKDFLGAK